MSLSKKPFDGVRKDATRKAFKAVSLPDLEGLWIAQQRPFVSWQPFVVELASVFSARACLRLSTDMHETQLQIRSSLRTYPRDSHGPIMEIRCQKFFCRR